MLTLWWYLTIKKNLKTCHDMSITFKHVDDIDSMSKDGNTLIPQSGLISNQYKNEIWVYPQSITCQ